MKNLLKKFLISALLLTLLLSQAIANPKNPGKKVKFYNFDDLLINGKVKKPQVLYTDAMQKVKFGKLLKLKKDFLPKLRATRKDHSLR